jgi:hypothetical protein
VQVLVVRGAIRRKGGSLGANIYFSLNIINKQKGKFNSTIYIYYILKSACNFLFFIFFEKKVYTLSSVV